MTPLDPLAHPLSGVNLVEASAGTGKTFTITTLFLRLLLERRLGVGEILVVTYTNAATAELRTRLRVRLAEASAALAEAAASGPPSPGAAEPHDVLRRLAESRRQLGTLEDDRRRLAAALYAFDDAAVFTIHGFCQRVLQEHAFESGMLFDARLVTDQRPLVREIVRDFWVRRLHDAPAGFVRYLRKKRDRLDELTGFALRAAGRPDVPLLPRLDSLPQAGSEEDDECRFLRLRLELVEHTREELRRRKEAANILYFDDLLTRLRDALARPGGELLAEKIRQRHPAALIDEFQDTDPIQYRIFRAVYGEAPGPLFLVGDPKQAIYGFRGADVFTYVEAKEAVAAGHDATLLVNRRSDPGLLAAVNRIFDGARRQFVLDGIPFHRAEPPEDAVDRLGGACAGRPPFEILYLRKGDANCIGKTKGREDICRGIAAEISRLLESGATVDGEQARPNHIAVLCRTNDEARRMQRELRWLRVPSVLQTDESVLETDEAAEAGRILDALAEPGDTSAIVSALATSLLGVGAGEIHALREGTGEWDRWTDRFHRWHGLWLEAGFMPAFRGLLEDCQVAEHVLATADGERRMTNLLHLGELLHNAAAEGRRGPLALAEWYAEVRTNPRARADAIGDAAQIRLESDDLALRLATIHRSKGLEYPIVYCPFLWDGSLLRGSDKEELRFHDPRHGSRLTIDIGASQDREHKALAEREALAENVRLLYVALTRARHRCTVVWGLFKDAATSALGYLLHQDRSDSDAGAAALVAATKARIEAMSDEQMLADLERLRRSAGGSIEIAELSTELGALYRPPDEGEAELRFAEPARGLSVRWRTASFSALIAGGEPLSHEAEEGIDRDEADEGEVLARPARAPAAVTLADFPAGTRAGQLLHSVFEHLDFEAGDVGATVAAQLDAYGFDPALRQPLERAVGEILQTPLDDAAAPLRLADVSRAARLNEMEFLFPVLDPSTGAPGVHSGDLAAVFASHGRSLPPAYVERLRRLGFAPLSGYLKGYVDMAFLHGGRWYVVDYKSNHLGERPDHYEPPRLLGPMEQHHYFLQYHLYAVALHRYLKARLRDYDYERHFGGVYYLFLRGMSPAYPLRNGVFADRPPAALIEGLSSLLAGGAP